MQVDQSIAPIGSPIDDSSVGIGETATFGEIPGWNSSMMSDGIRRSPFPIQWPTATGTAAGLNTLLAQLCGLLQQLLSALGSGLGIGGSGNSSQNFFQSAQASSTGDPHLAFNGRSADGMQQARFDSMNAEPDLLDSDSFRGGLRIGTSVTKAGQNGVTYNERATVTTDSGSTVVSLDKDGNAQISRNGNVTSLSDGQRIRLNSRESVTRNADGSLIICERNGNGGAITTTMRGNGQGVDLSIEASAVDLGGDLVRHT